MGDRIEKRREPRTIIDEFYSVELILPSVTFIYQFRIWNLSSQGICILVKDDSEVLKHLRVGDTLEMKYYPTDKSTLPQHLKTEIRHVTKEEHEKFEGHTLVGLQIVERLNSAL
jgi:hypothetical protein